MRKYAAVLGATAILVSMAACGSPDVRLVQFSVPTDSALAAGVGDTVADVRIFRLPFAGAFNLFGTRESGRVLVKFAGAQDGKAVLVLHYLMKLGGDANPVWSPVGVASPLPDYAATGVPLSLSLAPGEFLPLEGRRLTVRRVEPTSLEYTLEKDPESARE